MIKRRDPNLIRRPLCCLFKGPQTYLFHYLMISHPYRHPYYTQRLPSSSSLQPMSSLSRHPPLGSQREVGGIPSFDVKGLVPSCRWFHLLLLKFIESLLQPVLSCYFSWLVERSRKVLGFFKNQKRKIKKGLRVDPYPDLVQAYSSFEFK